MKLMQDYIDEGRTIYLDNFYTTPKTSQIFLGPCYLYCWHSQIKQMQLYKRSGCGRHPQGHIYVFFSCQDIMIVKFRAHKNKSNGKPKVVHVLTTRHSNVLSATKEKDGAGEVVKKPTGVIDYNLHMGGVAKIDHQLYQLHALRKNYKWHKKILF